MKKIILSGEDAEVNKVIRENRIRVDRGLISFKEVGKKESDTKKLKESDTKNLGEVDDKPENTPTV